jgi:type II secretory ATPase GspE/PulE/Tfp pilus assembly ATPase PilB-like protein
MTDLSEQRCLARLPAPRADGHAGATLAALRPIIQAAHLIDAVECQSRRPTVRIGEALLALGLIDERALGDALQQQTQDRTRPLGELLVQRGLVSRDDLQAALAHRMGFPMVDAAAFPVEPDAIARLPRALAHRLAALPLLLRGDRLIVALDDPSARIVVDEIEFATDCTVVPVLASTGSLLPALERFYADAAPIVAPDGACEAAWTSPVPTGDDRGPDSDAAVQQQVEAWLRDAHAAGATALHIESSGPAEPLRARQRCAGRLRLVAELPALWRAPLVARLKTLAGLDLAEQRRPQCGRVDLADVVAGQALRVQVLTLPTADATEDLVLRLSTPPRARPLQALGLPPAVLARFIAAIEQPTGLVLCIGPRGSGLTTLLHAALAHLNTPQRRLWTVESTIDVRQPGLRQLQLNARIDATAAKAVRALHEADADVVAVDAPLEVDALLEALALAQAGPLVLAAVQAPDATAARALLVAHGADATALDRALRATLTLRPGHAAVFVSDAPDGCTS